MCIFEVISEEDLSALWRFCCRATRQAIISNQKHPCGPLQERAVLSLLLLNKLRSEIGFVVSRQQQTEMEWDYTAVLHLHSLLESKSDTESLKDFDNLDAVVHLAKGMEISRILAELETKSHSPD